MTDNLNIFDVCAGTRALGPGFRYVIWVQGCPFNCKGCTSPEGRPVEVRILADIRKLSEAIVENQHITGITISGGEPFLQAASLTALLTDVCMKRPDLTVIVFTGFLIEQLDWDSAQSLLKLTDVLIDGPYIEELNDNVGLRGSSNQRIHFLSDRLAEYRERLETGARINDVFVRDGYQRIVGVPTNTITNLK
jgi:anaerobic ribonucleoside-triphosphate reductase activating protein